MRLPLAVQHVGHAHVDDESDKVFGLPVGPYVPFLDFHDDGGGGGVGCFLAGFFTGPGGGETQLGPGAQH